MFELGYFILTKNGDCIAPWIPSQSELANNSDIYWIYKFWLKKHHPELFTKKGSLRKGLWVEKLGTNLAATQQSYKPFKYICSDFNTTNENYESAKNFNHVLKKGKEIYPNLFK
jgi:hypothetical protein